MTDRFAVVWTRVGGKPLKMGNVVATDRECRFTYEQAFIDSGLPGFSLVAPPDKLGTRPLIHAVSERFPLPPRLMAMIPPNTPGNLQRRVYAEFLAKLNPPPPPGFETEWAILMLAGRNGIGHLDVFPSDIEAERWYVRQPKLPPLLGGKSGIWHLLREGYRDDGLLDVDAMQQLAAAMGPTPSVGGMTAKFLAAIPDRQDWDGTGLARPGVRMVGRTPYTDVIVKVEQPSYEGVVALEALAYEALRFRVPRRWKAEIEGMKVLAVERFDRTKQGLPVPYESLLTIFAGGSSQVTSTADLELPDVAAWIKQLAKLCALDVNAMLQEIFRRISAALMTGNGDLHLDNLGLLGGYQGVTLAPVFDPAPMRAWPQHNMRMATPVAFEPDTPVYRQIARVGTAFGFTEKAALAALAEAATESPAYLERVAGADWVPAARKALLDRIVREELDLLQQALTAV